jgi:hypothetical protein
MRGIILHGTTGFVLAPGAIRANASFIRPDASPHIQLYLHAPWSLQGSTSHAFAHPYLS